MLRKSTIVFLIPALLLPAILFFAQKPFPYTAEENADAPGDKKVVAMGGIRSLGELTKKYGRPRFYRMIYTLKTFEVQK